MQEVTSSTLVFSTKKEHGNVLFFCGEQSSQPFSGSEIITGGVRFIVISSGAEKSVVSSRSLDSACGFARDDMDRINARKAAALPVDAPGKGPESKLGSGFILRPYGIEESPGLVVPDESQDSIVHRRPGMISDMRLTVDRAAAGNILPHRIAAAAFRLQEFHYFHVICLIVGYEYRFHFLFILRFSCIVANEQYTVGISTRVTNVETV